MILDMKKLQKTWKIDDKEKLRVRNILEEPLRMLGNR